MKNFITKSALKVYLFLIFSHLLIMVGFFQLSQYYSQNIQPILPPNALHALTNFVVQLQKTPEQGWSLLLQKKAVPWLKLTLSNKPLYKNNALMTLSPPITMELIKKNPKLEASVWISSNTWINIEILSPVFKTKSLFITLLLMLLIALVLVDYWAVKMLNQPIHTLIQSLDADELKNTWHPIPLTGNSDQKLILQRINMLQNKLHKIFTNRTRVVTAISHDLRTPLTRLKLRSELINNSKISHKIAEDIHEMEMMIRDTLDYFENIHGQLKLQRFDLISMIFSIKDDMSELNEHINFKPKYEKIIYNGSLNLLKRALINIINNALYYGQIAIIDVQKSDKAIEINISDKGPGLSQDEQDKIFEPFYRGEHSRSRMTGGAGLGLTIAKEIIELHKGFINLNNLEEGLKVTIILPIVA